jgi:hypothetical protein
MVEILVKPELIHLSLSTKTLGAIIAIPARFPILQYILSPLPYGLLADFWCFVKVHITAGIKSGIVLSELSTPTFLSRIIDIALLSQYGYD